MPPPDAAEPEIPDAAKPIWEELNKRAIPARQRAVTARDAAQDEVDKASADCRRLVVDLFHAGVRPYVLIGKPFSEGWLTRIRREAGLTRKRRAAARDETGSNT